MKHVFICGSAYQVYIASIDICNMRKGRYSYDITDITHVNEDRE